MVVPVLVLLAAQPTPVERAAAHAARGESAEALGLLADAGMTDATAHLIRACVALEAGDIPAAGRASAALVHAAPDSFDAKVLPALVSRRAALPREPWLESLGEAFEAAGVPDLSSPPVSLPPVHVERTPSEAELWPLRGSADGFLVRTSLAQDVDPSLIQAALAEVARRDGTPAAWWIAASLLTSDRVPAPQRPTARRAARRIAERLAKADPGDGYAALAGVLLGDDVDGPFTDDELNAAEMALRRQTLRLPLGAVFGGVRRAWMRVDPAQADARAFAAASRHFVPEVHLTLQRRTESVAGEVPPRVSKLLVSVRERLAAGDTMLDRSVASALAVAAAELRASGTSVAAAREARNAVLRVWSVTDRFPPLQWPIPSLLRERWRREVRDGVGFRKSLLARSGVFFVVVLSPPTQSRVEVKVTDVKGAPGWSASRTNTEGEVLFWARAASDRDQVLDVLLLSPGEPSCRARALLKAETVAPFATFSVERNGNRCDVVVEAKRRWESWSPPVGDFPPFVPSRFEWPERSLER